MKIYRCLRCDYEFNARPIRCECGAVFAGAERDARIEMSIGVAMGGIQVGVEVVDLAPDNESE